MKVLVVLAAMVIVGVAAPSRADTALPGLDALIARGELKVAMIAHDDPPMIVTDADLDEIMDKLTTSLLVFARETGLEDHDA